MADIKFKGFVEPHTGRGPWTVVENHRRKDENEQWVTDAKTYHRVWLPKDGVEPAEGSLVEVIGKQKTTKYVKDGETKYSLIVQADSVETVSGGSARPASPDDEIPF